MKGNVNIVVNLGMGPIHLQKDEILVRPGAKDLITTPGSARASPIEAFDSNKDDIESGEVGAMRVPARFFSLQASDYQRSAPVTPAGVPPILAYLKTGDGPVTYLPLPPHAHEVIKGWYKRRPRASPSINASFSLDRQSYAELGLNLPRLRQSGINPGRSADRPSICDTGAQLTVIPETLLDSSMRIKSETILASCSTQG